MFEGKTILAIVPARGGSKGVPRKNIRLLAGKPLIAWTIDEAKKSRYIDRLILSSEDDEIIEVAREFGCEIPFKRPDELAQDDTPGIESVIHAINTLEEKYDFVVLLQPTSPLRTVEDIDGLYSPLHNNRITCLCLLD
jgi:CMP-N,N'-diacetyllegionaminic acid synthase